MTTRSDVDVRRRRPATQPPPHDQNGYVPNAEGTVRETVPEPSVSSSVPSTDLVRETVSPSPTLRLFGTAVRVVFGLIWAIDVYFKWQPSFLYHLSGVMSDGTKGQPSFLMPWFNFTQGVIAVHPTAWAFGIAIVETGIAFALILGFARKLTYIGGAIYSLLIWSTAEGFGRMSGVATDIGTAIIYVIVFLALLALDARGKGTRPYSLDAIIERRLPWWRRLAEVRR